MKISFHGAARTVTGSKHLVQLDNGTRILLDCGLFQGMGPQTDELNSRFGFKPESLSFVILSHAHIDHTGLLPKLVKEGFTGPIYATPATKDLTEILLYDSAEIQTYDTEAINKKRKGSNLPPFEPLYTSGDVAETMKLFQTIDYDTWFAPTAEVSFIYTNTGHLIGSAAVTLKIKEKGKEVTISFSGDVGRYGSVLLQPPAPFPQADYLILESTYGDTRHDLSFNVVKTLRQWIEKTCIERKGKLVIPAFSVGRTQEVLYGLNQLSLEKRLPEVPYFIDSPLSLKATETVKKYTDLFNERLQQVLRIDNDPFHFPGLKYVESVEDSQRLVNYSEPCVVISASGTADAGRVRHHINSCITSDKNSILFVGYCG
ncbi:MAG: MBL fold metallo-hydrolase, partial [Flavisolibacter sp.]|nr:MBL fold metallo-hydrolase [Flavisolibacter sp.]